MDKETYEKQKAFAGEKIPSMQRRCVGHDYQGRQMYMITMVTENRRPLFGHVVGSSNAEKGSPEEPRIVLSELGKAVEERKAEPEFALCGGQGAAFQRERTRSAAAGMSGVPSQTIQWTPASRRSQVSWRFA